MSSKLFTDFGLTQEMLKAIGRLGFEQPSPIQAQTLPPLLEGKDLVGQSQTGSGKTAAFGIPIIERIQPTERGVQTLILCPTRELAVQVSEEIRKLSFFKTGIKPLPVYGGQSYDRQFVGLKSGANIVIGTPGRVMDHMNRGTLVLDKVKAVVLDEADEMLNMGFRDDIEFILKGVPADRQTVLFSATVPRAIEELISRYTRQPVRIRIEGQAMTVPTVEQVYVEVDRRRKMETLGRLVDLHDIRYGIVFCNTQRMVDELAEHMNAAGYNADCIHGGMAQAARDRVMKKFRTRGIEFLVATDVAARGIDVDDIQAVFNYDLPYDGEDYVHRIGRTGRAGRSGIAFSFVSGREVFLIRQIERFTRQRMRRIDVPTMDEVEEARTHQLVANVRETIAQGNFRHYDHIIEGLLEEGVDSIVLANALLHHLCGANAEAAAETAREAQRGFSAPPSAPRRERERQGDERPAPRARVASPPPAPQPGPSAPRVERSNSAESEMVEGAEGTPPESSKPATEERDLAAGTSESKAADSVATSPGRTDTSKSSPPAVRRSVEQRSEAGPRRERGAGVERSARPGREREGERRTGAGASREERRPWQGKKEGQEFLPPWKRQKNADQGYGGAGAGKRPARDDQDGGSGRPEWDAARPPRADRKMDRNKKTPPWLDKGAGKPGPVAGAGEKSAMRPGRPGREEGGEARRPASRRTPAQMTRLWIGVGKDNGISPGDIKGCILGETGIPSGDVGYIDFRDRHSFVDVASHQAGAVVSKLKRAYLGGRKVKVKVASLNTTENGEG